jgi:hypothetical protein
LSEKKFLDSWIAFNPNQIKLADGRNTTFDSKNTDIRFNNGGNTKNKIMENKIKFSREEQKDFNFWKQDGNVSKNEDGSYSTQDAQWTNNLKDLDALKQYYYKEFLSDSSRYADGGQAGKVIMLKISLSRSCSDITLPSVDIIVPPVRV